MMREEDLLRFTEYLDDELTRRKKYNGTSKIIQSRANYYTVMHLYECAWKSSNAFENFKAAQNEDSLEILNDNLDRLNIESFEDLQKWAQDIKKNSQRLIILQKEGKSSLSRDEFMDIVRLKRMRRKKTAPFLTALMHEFAKGCGNDFTARDMLSEFIEIMNPADVARLYDMLLLTLAPKENLKSDEADQTSNDSEHGEKDSKKDKDSAKKKKKDKEKESEAEARPENENQDLAAQIDELKLELERTYIRLNASEEEFERFQQESKELATVNVLELMNSKESGRLLDMFARSEQTLKQLSSNGYEIPSELSSVSLCVRIFMQTMRNVFKISPVHEIGTKLKLNLEQAENYDYSGTDFDDKGEVKTVEVKSPGWRYKKEIFSLPKVIECGE